jgi:DNA-binding Xre family transcriptional regulator
VPTIPEALKAARRRKNISQKALADIAGISWRTVQNMESPGGHDCHLDAILAVCGVLGCELGSVVRHPRREGPWVAERP